jgi:hypothetical protein
MAIGPPVVTVELTVSGWNNQNSVGEVAFEGIP